MSMNELFVPVKKALSRVESLPLLSKISPTVATTHSRDDETGYQMSQQLSFDCVSAVSTMLQPGWTEKEAANAMEIWLRDHGVRHFFHKPFVWWGNRTRFDGVKTYRDYQPTSRRLLEGEIFILDVAPIVNGYISDIGFTGVIGDNSRFTEGRDFLRSLRDEIPLLFNELRNGSAVWRAIDMKIKGAGFENIHAKYPFGVLGHRVHKATSRFDLSMLHFGWQSYWEFTSRGLFGQLLDADHVGRTEGLWAIEPHIGGQDFGMKFEEILVVESGGARWLEPNTTWAVQRTTALRVGGIPK